MFPRKHGHYRRGATSITALPSLFVLLLLIITTAMTTRACAATAHANTPPTTHSQSPAATSLTSCYLPGLAEKVRCGTIMVPEDSNNPTGQQIAIHYAVLPAIKNSQPDRAMLAISGGPGQSAIDNAPLFNRLLHEVRQFRDIILIDQRGTGRSSLLQCELPDITTALAMNDEQQDLIQQTQQCLTQQQADIRHYDSRSALEDFEAVRRHAGYRYLDLYGISYGTRMAQLYMRHYPQALTTVTLDGVVPMQQNLLYIGQAISRATQLMLDDCRQSPSCHQAYPNLAADLATIEQQLATQPITTTVAAPLSGEQVPLQLTRSKFLSAIRMALYSPNTRSMLPFAITQAAKQHYQPIIGLYHLTLDAAGIAMGMHASVICAEDIPFADEAALSAARQSYIGRTMVDSLQKICTVWQMPAAAADFHQPINSTIPTLLLSGQLDPATPPAWGELAMQQLRNARHLVAPYAGHGVAIQTCAHRLIADFVNGKELSALDADCLKQDTRRSFYLNANTMEAWQPTATQEQPYD
ncbi:alpha/beta hydrolase [Shewanella sp. NFH-SH190041]|uniref:alpha/beta hydrolase n=1 Tax=Shewanella sp. NFH-SH190041 TaxID=2950245 RepID=UPI0021C43342|nr:alpha/beta hydrolase [Shewanella sp. NFH-SH190041]